MNISDAEIEVFVAKYDKDGNFQFDLDEINAIQDNAGYQFENYDHLKLDARTGSATLVGKPVKKIKITTSQFRE